MATNQRFLKVDGAFQRPIPWKNLSMGAPAFPGLGGPMPVAPGSRSMQPSTTQQAGGGSPLPGDTYNAPMAPAPAADPMDGFNTLMLDLLKSAQGLGTADLLKRKRELQREAIGRSSSVTDEGIRTLSPSQQNTIRDGSVEAMRPELDANAYELEKAQQSIDNFFRVFGEAQKISGDFADKMTAPDSVIQNAKSIIEADPDNMSTVLAGFNDKSKQKIIESLDYTKIKEASKGYVDASETAAADEAKRSYTKSQADEALTNIDIALGILEGTAGGTVNTAGSSFGRAVGQFVPGSDTRNLNATLDTIKALVGFDALQKMREASPTGGALGQITERELAFLQSVQGSLNVTQGTEQLKATIQRIRKSFQTLQIVNSPDGSEFELDGQKYIKQGNQMVPAGASFNMVGNTTASNRPQRNNNPLNLKASAATSTYAGVKGVDPRPATDGGKFLVFDSPESGFAAAKRLLNAPSYKGLSVDAAMRRWSGGGYGADVEPSLKDRTMSSLTAAELDKLINAMAKREGYYA